MLFRSKEIPSDINAITKSAVGYVAGTGLLAVAKDSLPRVGVTPGLVASFARVEIDTETGKIEVKELVTVADCGTVLHPMGLGNQMKGGAVQGLGMGNRSRDVVGDQAIVEAVPTTTYGLAALTILVLPGAPTPS